MTNIITETAVYLRNDWHKRTWFGKAMFPVWALIAGAILLVLAPVGLTIYGVMAFIHKTPDQYRGES